MNPNPRTILIVEDDDLQYEIYEDALTRYQLVRARNGSEALAQIPKRPPNLLILDHILAADVSRRKLLLGCDGADRRPRL